MIFEWETSFFDYALLWISCALQCWIPIGIVTYPHVFQMPRSPTNSTKCASILDKPPDPHYSKRQIFVQKFNIFTSFSPKFFWQFFSWNQSCQQLKLPKPQHFHEFFTQKIDNFLGKSKLNFWTKNEDFEQCETPKKHCCCWSYYSKMATFEWDLIILIQMGRQALKR